MNKILKFVIVPILFFVMFQQAQGAGLSVKPSKLNFNLQAKSSNSQNIVIENISEYPVIYNLYADELIDQIFIEPNNFRLEVGEKIQVKIKVRPEKEGLLATNISIVAQDLDRRKFNVDTGVKVPVVMNVSPAPAVPLTQLFLKIMIVLLPLAFVVLITALIINHKQKKWYQRLGDSAINLVHHKKPWWKL